MHISSIYLSIHEFTHPPIRPFLWLLIHKPYENINYLVNCFPSLKNKNRATVMYVAIR